MQPILLEGAWTEVLPLLSLSGTTRLYSSWFSNAYEQRSVNGGGAGVGRAIAVEVRVNMVLCPTAVPLLCEVWSVPNETFPDDLSHTVSAQLPVLAFPVWSLNAGNAWHHFMLEWPWIRGGGIIALSSPTGVTTQRVILAVRRWKMGS